jgi:uncharacterized protein
MKDKPFEISLLEVLASPIGFSQEWKLEGVIPNEEDLRFLDNVKVIVTATNLGEQAVEVEVEVKTKIGLICSRCALEITQPIDLLFGRIYSRGNEDEVEKMDDTLKIDLEQPIREEIILGIPIKVLCKENCQGLLMEDTEDVKE